MFDSLTRTAAARSLVPTDRAGRHPLVMAEGSLEAIKWLALLGMVLDHVNRYCLAGRSAFLFDVGRLPMPMFAFVLAYNLARPRARERGVHRRMITRLAFTGAVATPVCWLLNRDLVYAYAWWPLNILWTLSLLVILTYLIERKSGRSTALAVALFLVGGALGEFFWMGVLAGLAAWYFCRHATLSTLLIWFLALLSLTLVNGNAWAVLALPTVLLLGQRRWRTARLTRFFYACYPAHLAMLLALRWFIGRAPL
jgi:hypothetical protein